MYQTPMRQLLRTGIAVGAIHVGFAVALLSTFAGGAFRQVIDHGLNAKTWTYVPPRAALTKPLPHPVTPARDSVAATQPPIDGLATTTIPLAIGPLMPPQMPGMGDGFARVPEIPVPHPTPAFAPVAAHPLGDRGAWITPDDYPSRALHEGWSGVTRLHLVVDSNGRVDACSVIGPSGHAELDTVACAKVTQRARFSPARDGSGAPRDGTFDTAIRWRINEVGGD